MDRNSNSGVHRCCVPQCSNYRKEGSRMRFHRFPCDEKLREKWTAAIGINPMPSMRVCEEHFVPSDYLQVTEGKTPHRLKKVAVPSQKMLAGQCNEPVMPMEQDEDVVNIHDENGVTATTDGNFGDWCLKCCVPKCNNYARKGGLSFHLFPKNPKIKEKWIAAIGRDHRPFLRVCEEHFLPSDVTGGYGVLQWWTRNHSIRPLAGSKYIYVSGSGAHRLKKKAVPSQKLPVEQLSGSSLLLRRKEGVDRTPDCEPSGSGEAPASLPSVPLLDLEFVTLKKEDCDSDGAASSTFDECTHSKKRPRKREKRHTCEFCDYRSSNIDHLRRHLRTHTGEKPHACDLCDFSTIQISNLKTHYMRIHKGMERAYVCDVCDFKTFSHGDLKSHSRIHTGEKPYVCEFCDYKCIKMYNLKRHIRTHTGEKIFACKHCDYRSTRQSAVDNHNLNVHNIEMTPSEVSKGPLNPA